MTNLELIDSFLTEAGMFFLASEDQDQAKCRPLRFHKIINDQLYFAVGDFKDVYKQLCKNPKLEIVAVNGMDWLRFYGKAVFEESYELAQMILEASPHLQSIYNDDTNYKYMVFHLEDAAAEFRSTMTLTKTFIL